MGNFKKILSNRWVRKRLIIIFLQVIGLYFCLKYFFLSKPTDNTNSFKGDSIVNLTGKSSVSSAANIPIDATSIFADRPDWQDIGHAQYNFSVYTAYSFDNGKGFQKVTVIAAYAPFPRNETVKCRFYTDGNSYSKGNSNDDVIGRMVIMPGWDDRFAGNYINCRIPNKLAEKPTSVSILVGDQTESATRLEIRYQSVPSEKMEESQKSYQYQFSVCVMPIFGLNQVFHFLEWFEFNKFMGVQQFTFYNMSIGPELSCALNQLKKNPQGAVVHVDPWQIYGRQTIKESSRKGFDKPVSICDCHLRHMGITKYLSLIDIDEFIMPREEAGLHNYNDLVKYLDAQDASAKYGEYRFRNGFYEKEQKNDEHVNDRCRSLVDNPFEFYVCQTLYMNTLVRRNHYHSFGDRTKYIIRPERVAVPGMHYVAVMKPSFKSSLVPADIAFSRHYRKAIDGIKSTNVTIDKISEEFGVSLAKNVAERVTYIMDKCNLSKRDLFK